MPPKCIKLDRSRVCYVCPATVLLCAGCGYPIFEGDQYLDMGDDQYCCRCMAERIKTAKLEVE